MDKYLLEKYIILPVLSDFHGHFPDKRIVNLLLGTAAQESFLGKYIFQIKGPAIGIYQIEPETHKDVINNYLNYREAHKKKVWKWRVGQNDDEALIGSLFYQTLIARLIYQRIPEKLPEPDDIAGMAYYWKKYYNTVFGKGEERDFVNNYLKYVKNA